MPVALFEKMTGTTSEMNYESGRDVIKGVIPGVKDDLSSIKLTEVDAEKLIRNESREVLQRRGRRCVQYFTAASGMPPISTEMLKDFGKKESAKTFDEFRKLPFGLWVITITDEGAAESSLCSCPYFLKNNTCKHVLGMLIRLKVVQAPDAAKCIPLGQKRKRGRPAKAKRVLLVQ